MNKNEHVGSTGYEDINQAYEENPGTVIIKESHANILNKIPDDDQFWQEAQAE